MDVAFGAVAVILLQLPFAAWAASVSCTFDHLFGWLPSLRLGVSLLCTLQFINSFTSN